MGRRVFELRLRRSPLQKAEQCREAFDGSNVLEQARNSVCNRAYRRHDAGGVPTDAATAMLPAAVDARPISAALADRRDPDFYAGLLVDVRAEAWPMAPIDDNAASGIPQVTHLRY
jgi:hypothetical protein